MGRGSRLRRGGGVPKRTSLGGGHMGTPCEQTDTRD